MAKKDALNPTPPNLPLSGEEMISVAYHSGPAWIGFCGKHWYRDEAQSVTAEEWAAMQARGDFNEFNFTEEQ